MTPNGGIQVTLVLTLCAIFILPLLSVPIPVQGAKAMMPPPCYYPMDANKPMAYQQRDDMIYRRPCYDPPPPPPPPPPTTKTLIVVILDESGSMEVQKSDVIGGFNSFIDTQREVMNDKARLILIKFNTVVDVAHGAKDLSQVPHLNSGSYRPGGGTALYDAVSEGITIADGAAQPEERVLVLIMTDGEENSSKKATSSAVKSMIAEKEGLGTWTFAYIGANPDAWALRMGQTKYNVREYNLEDQGVNMEKASGAVSNFRAGAAPQSKAFFKDN